MTTMNAKHGGTGAKADVERSGHDDVAGPLLVGASLDALRERAAARLGAPPRAALLEQRVAFTFAGQGAPWAGELDELLATRGRARELLLACIDAVADEERALSPLERARMPASLGAAPFAAAPVGAAPFEAAIWTSGRLASSFDEAVLARAPLSAPFAVAVQLARAEQLLELGLDGLIDLPAERRPLVAGHSQGALAALALSAMLGEREPAARREIAARMSRVALRLGIAMESHDVPAAPPSVAARAVEETGRVPTPMAALTGFFLDELRALLTETGVPVTVAVANAPLHHTLAGAPADLEALRLHVVGKAKALFERKKKGQAAGRIVEPKWAWLDVSGPFHSAAYAEAARALKVTLAARGLGLPAGALSAAVIDARHGLPFADDGSALDAALDAILVEPASWQRVMQVFLSHRVEAVVDLGPGEDVAHLSGSALRGRGVAVLAAARPEERAAIVDARRPPAQPVPFSRWAPRVVELPGGAHRIDNRFTRLTGRPPVLVPGMTPTTVEAPLVVAAANAGYVAELAGGGQVTEKILRARLEEIRAALAPGQGIVFNALYLDPYLWGLHFAKDRLVFKLREEGYPIVGVTVSAGVPPLEEATVLLDELFARGIAWNAFKPGNDRQLAEVIAIARARPGFDLFVHIEGGKAGGHHSWEDLDDLLVRHYAALRACPNLVVCVGGGIGTEEQATAYLTGRWSERHGLVAMPVDAVFLGTRLMATKEAGTSPDVKRALVAASGDEDRWPLDGAAVGGVTSGRSSLDAPIYYLDNDAARCGRLLDEVAGDADRVRARRAEIVAALEKTAKPWFGDVEEMTPAAVLGRMLELMFGPSGAAGAGQAGTTWRDESWRARFVEVAGRLEARFAATAPTAPAEADVSSLVTVEAAGEPWALRAALLERCPALSAAKMHPEDARFFLEVCRRPGKPVPFVPVLDADVRRWFKSDSLWQSHDAAFAASAVLAIPGPAAVGAIRVADEPVASVLHGFHQHMVASVLAAADAPRRLESLVATVAASPLERALALREVRDGDNRAWPNPLRALFVDVADAARVVRVHDDGGRLVEVVRVDGRGRPLARATARGAWLVLPELPELSELRDPPEAKGGEVTLDLGLTLVEDGCGGHLRQDRDAFLERQHAFMSRAIFGEVVAAAPLFSEATETTRLTVARVRDFRAATRDDTAADGTAPLTMAFSLAWKAVFRALAGARPDVLRLVHEQDRVEGGPLRVGDELTAVARVTRVETLPGGRRVITEAALTRPDGRRAATVTSRFFIRETIESNALALREDRPVLARLRLDDEGALDFLRGVDGVSLFGGDEALPLPAVLRFEGRALDGRGGGVLLREAGSALRQAGRIDAPMAAIDALVEILGERASVGAVEGDGALGVKRTSAPAEMDAYAEASGDRNPLHAHDAAAALAGFQAPIVHGMWTASWVQHRVARLAADGDASRVDRFEASFFAPVSRGVALTVSVRALGREQGALVVQADVEDAQGTRVATATARVRPPKTAYVFCGQGVQHAGMGMETYGTSAAARAVWDEADGICRARHGFSLLEVVRDNPRELVVRGQRLVHPDGVLHLTQLTQVALAVMAVAEVEHLRERGALVEGARFAGHSLGEYSALAAVPRVLPLAAVVDVVYHRGLTMDRLVARDAEGRSPFAMGALRPNLAGMTEAEALALVDSIGRDTRLPLFVVNHNVRGRQYAVTGDRRALARLREVLVARSGAGRPAWVDVPGIDVPFHSPLLRDGVDAFRATLEQILPARIDAAALDGRYVPNLTGTLFRLEPAFLREVLAASGSARVMDLLERFEDVVADKGALARALLVEVLAYQFASPVRWIQAQDVLLAGADAVQELVEVGPAKQPVLTGMAKATLEGAPPRRRPRLLHAGLDAQALWGVARVEDDAPPVPVAGPSVVGPSVVGPPLAVAPDLGGTRSAGMPAAAASVATPALPEPRCLAEDALVTLLCTTAKKERADVDLSRSLDHLLGGNSARRNQVLAELAAELGGRAVDNAHEMPLRELASMLVGASKGEPGPVLRAAREQAAHKLLGGGGLDLARADAHWQEAWGLPAGHREHLKNRLATRARSHAPAADKASALALLDDVARCYGAEHGVALEKPRAETATAAVDAGALHALEERLFGRDGVLTKAAEALRGPVDGRGSAVTAVSAVNEDPEHDEGYRAAVAGVFDADRHVAFTSSWAWARRDLVDSSMPVELVAGRLDDQARALAERMLVDAKAHQDGARAARLEALLGAPVATLAYAGRTALVTGAGEGSIARAVVERLLQGGARVIATTSRTSPVAVASFKAVYQRCAAAGAELHVVPANQGSFADVDALVRWLGSSRRERVGSSERVLKEPWLPDLLLPFGAIAETADASSLGARSLAMFRVLVLGVERLVALTAALHAERGASGSRVHVVLPLSPNHGTFGGDGAYGECKAALEALLEKQRSEARGWGSHASIVGARIGWVRGTGLMHKNDDVAGALERRGLRTFSAGEMADLLLGLVDEPARARAATLPFVADLTGGLGEATELSAWLADARAAGERRARRERRRAELARAFEERLTPAASGSGAGGARGARPARSAMPVERLSRPGLGVVVPTEQDLAALPALDHLDLDELVVIVGTGEVGPWGSCRTRWAIERGAALSIEAVLELAWIMGLVKPAERGTGFVDATTGEPVKEHEAIARYGEHVRAHAGVRVVEPAVTGFDPRKLPRLVEVRLEQDFRFPVPSRAIAEALRAEDPDHTVIVADGDGGLAVVRTRGSVVRVPAALSVHRHVAGQIPTGWDATRYGVPKELVEQVDPVTLYCLVSTAEAFLAAGLSPDELYAHLHPGRVGITLGTGIGGMTKLKRLHRDFFEGNERQNDTLQETLINVIGGYVVQTFLGSYGPMSFPVGACATAGLSLTEAVDKIRTGQADLVVAGGADDLSEAGLIGFGDMGATADTDALAARGVEPRYMSRPSDARRRGFVEAQGAGVAVVCRASLAVKLGLPVYGVLAFAGTTGDGLQKSVPAPGQGALVLGAERRDDPRDGTACDLEGRRKAIQELEAKRVEVAALVGADGADAMIRQMRKRLGHGFAAGREDISPLRAALAVLGLDADDVGVVSKHDSSTQANDLNEARLHERLMTALGRSPDKPLWVISQKALTGHPKGAAAAWQVNGLLQAMAEGVIPGNASLDDVDPEMRALDRLVWTDRPVRVTPRELLAGFVTTLGFGHVSALVCVAHPFLFWRALDDDSRRVYGERLAARRKDADQRLQRVLSGRAPLFVVRQPAGDDAETEARLLLDAGARLASEAGPRSPA